MKKKKMIISITALILIIVAAYLFTNRELISLKSGNTLPIQWTNPYEDNEKPIKITTAYQKLSNPSVSITPLYYLPESKEIHFGLWYKKWQYRSEKIPSRVFQTTFKDQSGKVFDRETVTKVKGGWFDEFHYRAISVDLSNQTSLEMTISLIEEEGNTIIPMETTSIKISLDNLKF